MTTRRRSSAGFTLMETLLAIVATGLVAVPLLAWITASIQLERRTDASSTAAGVERSVAAALGNDVAGAATIEPITAAGSPAAVCGSGPGRLLLVLVAARVDPAVAGEVVEYRAVDRPRRPGRADVVRLRCRSGTLLSRSTIGEDVRPAGASWDASVDCTARCDTVELRLRLVDGSLRSMTASRRVDEP